MSQPLPTSAPPKAVAPKDARAAAPTAAPRPTPRVAFDPLDPQWRNAARDTSVAVDDSGAASTSGARKRPVAVALGAEELRRREQADAAVIVARKSFVRGEVEGAREQIKAAFAIDKSNAAGLELLGDIFLAEAEQEKAIQVFKRGQELHPDLVVFEEKIGLALLDIDEEKRDRDIAALLLEQPDLLRWAERKPALAASLSLLVPGAGQAYNDEPERGALLFGGAILLFGGWYWIFNSATSSLPGRQIIGRSGEALAQMGALAKLGFWALLLGWLALVAFAVSDAYQGARNANRAHRPFEV